MRTKTDDHADNHTLRYRPLHSIPTRTHPVSAILLGFLCLTASHSTPAADTSPTPTLILAVNPITKTNWEGVGVQPDVAVTADKALDMAHYLALKKLKPSQSPSDPKTQEIAAKLQELEKEFPGK